MQEREYLHNWVFHYNPFRKLWHAIPRDKYLGYWTELDESDYVVKSSDVNTLLDVLHKIKGDYTEIETLNKVWS